MEDVPVKAEYAAQYNCSCILVELGDTFEAVLEECIEHGATCDWEGAEDYVVQLPGRPQEVYSREALQRSMGAERK